MSIFTKKYTFLFTLLSICFLGFTPLEAQDWIYDYKYYGVEDGLNSRFVNHIFQDSRGFIWISTNNGVNQFDGQEFTSFIEKEMVHRTGEDELGNIWLYIKNERGNPILKYIDKNSLEVNHPNFFQNKPSKIEITNVFFKEKKIWFTTTEQKLYSFGKELVEEASFNHLPRNKSCQIISVSDDTYTVRRDGSLIEQYTNYGYLLNQICVPNKFQNYSLLLENKLQYFRAENKFSYQIELDFDAPILEFSLEKKIKMFNIIDVNYHQSKEWDLSDNRKAIWAQRNLCITTKVGNVIFDFENARNRFGFGTL